jgi:hypothetical protein
MNVLPVDFLVKVVFTLEVMLFWREFTFDETLEKAKAKHHGDGQNEKHDDEYPVPLECLPIFKE